tara:strand:+ start:862 stop:999 length:138 start_codon:yes stop_codon:yes gene_type:complete
MLFIFFKATGSNKTKVHVKYEMILCGPEALVPNSASGITKTTPDA